MPFVFNSSFLPCLINGADKSGASFFSLNLITQIILSDLNNIIVLTAFDRETEALYDLLWVSYFTFISNISDIDIIKPNKPIIIKSWESRLFEEVLKNIDIDKYILFVKNFEVYDIWFVEYVLWFGQIIISGDVWKCANKDKILWQIRWSEIFFTYPTGKDISHLPLLDRYQGYFASKKLNGQISVEI